MTTTVQQEHDARIEKLLAVIEQKKKEIEQVDKPNYITNRLILNSALGGNVQGEFSLSPITDTPTLIALLAHLKLLKAAFDDICAKNNIKAEFKVNKQYSFSEIEHDIIAQAKKQDIASLKSALRDKEKLLNSLMSEDVKKRKELDELEKELLG